MKTARVPALDGLRGLAIAAVLVSHYVEPWLYSFGLGTPAAYLARCLVLGSSGVDLFFVLSGYFIGGFLLDQCASPRLVQDFLVRRAARILPALLLCIGLTLLVHHLGGFKGFVQQTPLPPAVYVFSLANLWFAALGEWYYLPLAALWSLGIEEQFYLLAPWLVRLVPVSRQAHWLVVLIVAAPVFRWIMILTLDKGAFVGSMLPLGRADALGLGVLVAWLLRQPAWIARLRAHPRPLLIVLASTALVIAVMIPFRPPNGGYLLAAGGLSVLALFYASSLLWLELHRHSLPSRILAVAPLAWLGRRSYFIYLFQYLIFAFAAGILQPGPALFAPTVTFVEILLGLVLLLLASELSWRLFESPALALGRRFTPPSPLASFASRRSAHPSTEPRSRP